ncbi:hypothetical protein MBLNU457_3397t2 [Dothideomycetes sp. NU457]
MPRRFSLFSQRSRASSHDGSDRKLSMHDLEQATADVEYTALRMSKRWTADMSGLTSSHDHHSTLANRRKSSAVAPNQCAPPSSQSNIRNKRQSSIFVHQTETIVVTSIFDQPGLVTRHERISSCSSESRRSSRISDFFSRIW